MAVNFKSYNYKSCLVIEMTVEKFDFFEISESSQMMRDLLKGEGYPNCIFDLTCVKFVDSSVFGFLIEIMNAVRKNKNDIAIVNDDREVLRVMKMLKVSQLIMIFPRIEKALEFFKN